MFLKENSLLGGVRVPRKLLRKKKSLAAAVLLASATFCAFRTITAPTPHQPPPQGRSERPFAVGAPSSRSLREARGISVSCLVSPHLCTRVHHRTPPSARAVVQEPWTRAARQERGVHAAFPQTTGHRGPPSHHHTRSLRWAPSDCQQLPAKQQRR